MDSIQSIKKAPGNIRTGAFLFITLYAAWRLLFTEMANQQHKTFYTIDQLQKQH